MRFLHTEVVGLELSPPLTALPLVAHMCASLLIEICDRLIAFPIFKLSLLQR